LSRSASGAFVLSCIVDRRHPADAASHKSKTPGGCDPPGACRVIRSRLIRSVR
jgi:hypothetical protein